MATRMYTFAIDPDIGDLIVLAQGRNKSRYRRVVLPNTRGYTTTCECATCAHNL
jgi:hypothetical protein